jgi:G:T-mismatch repair DNA endonuclease (very short patch repair protein)
MVTYTITTKKDYRYFCNSCSAILGEKQKGMHPSEKTKTLMSKNHADFKGKKHPQWKGGLTKCTCLVCGKDFEVKPSTVKKGNGKYCSYSCAAKAKLHNARHTMTAPEKRFEIICKKHNLPFHFVGDGSLWLGNANPDFMHTTKKIVVEIFGDYWHSPLLNRNIKNDRTLQSRQKQLKNEGYKCIFIWESDLKRKDAEAFVVHIIQKGQKKI